MSDSAEKDAGLTEAIAAVLLEHRDSGVTTVYSGQGEDERITGAHAWCHCGGAHWEGGRLPDPKWRGTFNLLGGEAERELRQHIANAIATSVYPPGERSAR